MVSIFGPVLSTFGIGVVSVVSVLRSAMERKALRDIHEGGLMMALTFTPVEWPKMRMCES